MTEKRKAKKNIAIHNYFIWTIAIIIYIIPFFIDSPDGSLEFIWLIYFLPPVLLTIHYSYKGGIFAAILGIILQLSKEFYEYRFEGHEYKLRNLIVCLAISMAMMVVTLGFAILIRRLEKMSKHSESLAKHDYLTNLPNRRMFEEQLEQAIFDLKLDKRKKALIFCDLDGFKYINDTMGHFTGDLILIEVASRLQEVINQAGSVYRFGGDEFILLLEFAGKEEAVDFSEKIIACIKKPIIINNLDFKVTASLGIAIYPDHGLDAVTLMKHADIAMYYAKVKEMNSYFFFSPELEEDISRRSSLERSLKDALERKEFVLHYQPQIELESGRIVGVEALIRWIHPEKGLIPPGEFIPLAEETGLIVPIGEWVLRTAVHEAKQWHEKSYPLKISINISALQLQRHNCIQLINQVIGEEKFNPIYLELEITESSAMLNPVEIIKKLNTLRTLGIQIAIDDFGTGYSSFDYLKKYPVNTIKIDQSFIKNVAMIPRDRAMLEAMVIMVRNLECETVAEGVETEEQLSLLKELKCDLIQGYYFSKPVPAPEFLELLYSNTEMLKRNKKVREFA